MKNVLISTLVVLTTITTAQIDLTSNLVICMPMNGNANDFSGNNNNGLVSGATPTVNRFGTTNSAYHFNGLNSFISVPSSTSISNIENNDELTITAWCKVNNWYPAWNVFGIAEKYNPSSDWGWAFALHSPVTVGGGNDVILITNYPVNYQTNLSVTFGQWDFYAVTYSKSSQLTRFYKNGNLIQTFNNSGGQLENTGAGNFYIGYSPVGIEEYSDGDIDDLRLYNRELTSQEISALYLQPYTCAGELTPVASFSLSSKQICRGQSIVFADLSTNNPTTWNWQIPGGMPSSSSINNPTVSFSIPGVYTASLTSSNNSGASNTSTQTFTVSDCVSIFELNNSNSTVSVYPNPSQGQLYINNSENNSVLVYNVLGQKINVTLKQVNENTSELIFDGISHGIYMVQIFDEQGSFIQTSKVVIRK
jgi:PKD repeat protein